MPHVNDLTTETSKASPSPKRVRSASIAPQVGQDITAPRQVASSGRILIRTPRAAMVARWFGLRRADGSGFGCRGWGFEKDGKDDHDQPRPASSSAGSSSSDPTADTRNPNPALPLLPGTITLVTGPSGAGKSSLVRSTRVALAVDEPGRPWIDLAALPLPADLPLVDCFENLPLRDTLRLLAQVGLAEAWAYLRPPAELSEGQRWRLRLALALHAAAERGDRFPVLVCDEFAAVLDRVTAMVVSRCLRRALDAMPHLTALVATSHDDLQPALKPDVLVWCDFGRVEVRELA